MKEKLQEIREILAQIEEHLFITYNLADRACELTQELQENSSPEREEP